MSTKEIIPLEKLNIYSNYFNVSFDYLLSLSDDKEKNHVRRLDKLEAGRSDEKMHKTKTL